MKNVVGSSNRKMKRDWMVLLLFVMMLFLLMNYSINKGRMSLPGVTNRILDNIVTNDVYFEYMVTHYGLPRSAKECPHKKLWDSCTRNLSDFYPWVKQKSRNAYTKFLIRHPKYVANIIFREWIPTLQGEVGYKGDVEVHKAEDSPGTEVVTLFPYFGNKSYYAFTKRIMQKSFKITYGNYIGSFQKNHRFIVSLIPIFVFSLIVILFKFYKRNMLIMYPPILLILITLPQIIIVLFDTKSPARHALLTSISYNYFVIYMIFIVIQQVCEWYSNKYRPTYTKNSGSVHESVSTSKSETS